MHCAGVWTRLLKMLKNHWKTLCFWCVTVDPSLDFTIPRPALFIRTEHITNYWKPLKTLWKSTFLTVRHWAKTLLQQRGTSCACRNPHGGHVKTISFPYVFNRSQRTAMSTQFCTLGAGGVRKSMTSLGFVRKIDLLPADMKCWISYIKMSHGILGPHTERIQINFIL